jgi:hypothetical protein
MRKAAILTLCTFLATAALTAAEAKKPLSPPAKAEATLKGKAVTIDYSAPSKRGRTIMGELVPYGQVWRAGANAATTLTSAVDLMIGTLHVPAGTYTLYAIPAEKEWTLIVNKQTGQWGTKYDEAQDLGRTKMRVAKLDKPVETFRIAIDDKTLSMTWDDTKAWVPVIVH